MEDVGNIYQVYTYHVYTMYLVINYCCTSEYSYVRIYQVYNLLRCFLVLCQSDSKYRGRLFDSVVNIRVS